MLSSKLIQQFLFWGVWLVIPLLWDIIGGIISSIIVALGVKRHNARIDYYPSVSILIPVYNSEATLEMCLESIYLQNYPKDSIEVFLIDNGSADRSYEAFTRFQSSHPRLRVWWYASHQGKSKALNKGIFASTGKYVINIDSDGCLDSEAVLNVVKRFEYEKDIACMTGVILTHPDMIENTGNKLIKTIRICELFEYMESFFIGRKFQSTFNSMYTLAGAFSCFRREVLMKTQMYNSETIGEDTHMTLQIKDFIGGRIVLCEDAFFYTEPIESLDRLYIQRQRWQRAELEVASLFTGRHLGGFRDFLTKPAMRKMVSDHTLTFPRLIWFFAMIYLYFINYPLSLLAGANILLYVAYVINSFLYFAASSLYLKNQVKTKTYVLNRWYICLIMPLYRFLVYWVRVAGIINSIKTESTWRTRTFTEEINILRNGMKDTTKSRLPILDNIRRMINKD